MLTWRLSIRLRLCSDWSINPYFSGEAMEDLLPFGEFRKIRPEAFPGEYSLAIKSEALKVFAKVNAHLLIERFNGYDESKNPIFSKDTLGFSGYFCLNDKDYRTLFGSKKILKIENFNPERFLEPEYAGGKSIGELADSQEVNYGPLQFSYPATITQEELLVPRSSNWDAASLPEARRNYAKEPLTSSPADTDTTTGMKTLADIGREGGKASAGINDNRSFSASSLVETDITTEKMTPADLGKRGGERSAEIKKEELEKRDEKWVQHIKDGLESQPQDPRPLRKRVLNLSASAIRRYSLPPKDGKSKKTLDKKYYMNHLVNYYMPEYKICLENARERALK
jgi:hypothetical protein